MQSYLRLLLISSVFGLLTTGMLFAQAISDPEAEYSRIRETAFKGNYKEAEAAARRLVNQYPGYGDARILLGRIYAWQGEYEEAAAVIDTLLLTEPKNKDAREARKDIARWSSAGEETPPTDIRAAYQFDTYSKPYDRFWQMVHAGIGHKFDWGSLSGGINSGTIRIGEPEDIVANEFQFEAEAWPRLTSKNYAYLAYAYSPGKYFPGHRAAAEVWQTLPAGWAVSAGVNYFYFDRNVFIASLSGEKYAGDYWFSAKTYFYFKELGITTSLYLNARRYFNKTDYLQLTLGIGTAPDEPFDVSDLERLSSNSVRIAWSDKINTYLSIKIGAGYSYEEYQEGSYRNRFEGTIGLSYAIKVGE